MGFDGCRGWMRYDTSSNLFRSSLEPSLIRYSIKLESCELGWKTWETWQAARIYHSWDTVYDHGQGLDCYPIGKQDGCLKAEACLIAAAVWWWWFGGDMRPGSACACRRLLLHCATPLADGRLAHGSLVLLGFPGPLAPWIFEQRAACSSGSR